MRRKSNRTSGSSSKSTSTPEPKSERKFSRNSRRKRSPSQDSENDDNNRSSPSRSENNDECSGKQKVPTSVIVEDKNVMKGLENENEVDSDAVESHTPPHAGLLGNEAPNSDEVVSGKGKSKGINNSQVEENSEIKMNSVTSISAEDATSNNDVNPEVNVSHNMNSNDSLVNENQNTKSSEQLSDETHPDHRDGEEHECAEQSDTNSNINNDAETVDKSTVNQVIESEILSEMNNVEGMGNEMCENQGGTNESKDLQDDDQAEEGEIRESKSDEENDGFQQSQSAKAKKPPVKVKLRRDSFFETLEQNIETHDEPVVKKMKWDPDEYKCLKLSFEDLFKLDVDDFKGLSSDLKLADEKEVKLEETYQPKFAEMKHVRERVKSFDSSGETERPEYSKQSSTVSSDEQESTNIIAINRKISIVDDSASKLRPPPSPAKHPVSSVLYISNLVRPFTIKQLKELLERTGTIREEGFWTDRIKSKCYVQYESIEEAESTRNALHGVNWPIGNGKKLIIEYSTEEDMEKARNPPPQVEPTPAPKPAPIRAKTPQKENTVPVDNVRNGGRRDERKRKDSERDKERPKPASTREWDLGKEAHKERNRSRSRERRRKHSGRRSITPLEDFIARKQRKHEESVPQKLMDDLFQRTKTMPCIYWQPLSPEEISIKQQQRLSRMEEHKRRLAENSRNRGAREPGRGAYRRRYD